MIKKYLLMCSIALSIPAVAMEISIENKNIEKEKNNIIKEIIEENKNNSNSNLENKKKKKVSFNTVLFIKHIPSCYENESEKENIEKIKENEKEISCSKSNLKEKNHALEMIDDSLDYKFLSTSYKKKLKIINKKYDAIIGEDFYNNKKIQNNLLIIWKAQIETATKLVNSFINEIRVKLNSEIVEEELKERYKKFIQQKIMTYSKDTLDMKQIYDTLNDPDDLERDKIKLMLPELKKDLDQAISHIFELINRGFVLAYITSEEKEFMETRVNKDLESSE